MRTQFTFQVALLLCFASLLVLSGNDNLALAGVGIIAAVPIVSFGLYCLTAAVNGNKNCIQAVGVIAILLISVTIRFREYEDKSIDFQILMKIGSIGLMLFMVGVAYLMGRLKFSNSIVGVWLVFVSYLVITSIYSETFTFSAMTSLSLFSCSLFCFYLVQAIGINRSIEIVIISSAVICALSIFVFFAFPQLGKMHGWTGTEFGSLNRMRGVTPSANALGSMAALGFLFFYFYARQMRGLTMYIGIALVPLALICLVLSNNRMSMAGILITIVCASLLRGQTLIKGLFLGGAGILGLLVLVTYPDEILTSVSRSGDASEITSGTGRSFIWAVVIEHVSAKPFFGYGYSSSISVLPKDPRLFGVAAHAHNLYLEILFSGGVTALFLLFISIFWTMRASIRVGAFRESALLLFFLIKGVMEASPFTGIVSFNAFVFFFAIAVIASRNSVVPAQVCQREANLRSRLPQNLQSVRP